MNTMKTHFLKVAICVHPNLKCKESVTGERTNHYHWHTMKVLNYPSEVLKRRSWVQKYWMAKIQIRFPKHYVTQRVAGYYFPEDDEMTIKKRQISAARGQISKLNRLIDERRKELSTQLFQDYENDPFILKCRSKLENKETHLSNLLNS